MQSVENFIEKLVSIKDYSEFRKEYSKVIFTGKKISYSFLNLIKNYSKKKYNLSFLYNDISSYLENISGNEIYSFFDENRIDLFYFKYEDKDNFLKFIKVLKNKSSYFGYFDNFYLKNLNNENNDVCILNTDLCINNRNLSIISKLYPENYKYYIECIIKNYKEINLNYFCLLMQYAPCIKQSLWENYLVEIKKNNNNFAIGNIFDLTNLFFQKNNEEFFNLWNSLNTEYLPEFWIPYFLEQLWLAYLYLSELKATSKINNPYKKLCKWFMNIGYKKYSSEEIYSYYILLYESNNNIKMHSIDNIAYLEIVFNKIFNYK